MYTLIILISAYIAAQMISDITSLKIILLFGLSVDAGTLIYPITFTLRDLVHKTIGIKNTRLLIVCAAFINLFMSFMFWLSAQMPPDKSVGMQTEFSIVLSPIWRITVASIIAEVLSELVDTEVYQKVVCKFKHHYQWSRVLLSNAVSTPLDSLVFCTLAFYGTMPNATVFSIIMTNILLKGCTTLLSIPLIYAVPEH
jgi:uncharacterized integral membrane protein (TIGR00697 family)